MYKSRGFNIYVFHGYNKFNLNFLREHIRSASLKIFPKLRHIPIIERYIQTIKQGDLCTTQYFTYKRYTKIMKRLVVECIIHSRNSFTQKGSISKRLVSNTILLGKPIPRFNMKIIFFGSYAMVYAVTEKTLKRRIIPSISLR